MVKKDHEIAYTHFKMCIDDVIEAQRWEVICPSFYNQLLAELGLELGSPGTKMDSGAGEQEQPDQSWDLLPPLRGKSQGLDR